MRFPFRMKPATDVPREHVRARPPGGRRKGVHEFRRGQVCVAGIEDPSRREKRCTRFHSLKPGAVEDLGVDAKPVREPGFFFAPLASGERAEEHQQSAVLESKPEAVTFDHLADEAQA